MIYDQLLASLSQGSVVMATVINVKGSVPREIGAKMLIPESHCIDTIGGGAGEAKVITKAREVLQSGEKAFVEIDLTGATTRQTEGICGGWMQVFLERWQGEQAIALVQKIILELKLGRSLTLVTPFRDGNPYIIKEKGERKKEKEDEAFIETLEPAPILLIVGAGHVGEQLAKVAHLIGFQIAIQDDRPEWANSERYPQATFIYSHIDQALTELSNHIYLYSALVTRSYHHDLEALIALLNRDLSCSYIGMIGSERRVSQVYEQVKRLGIPTSKLQSIHAPIGLDIGALTPAEIAISIGAELIMLRRGGTGRSLSASLRESSRKF
ncbi:MAG: xanthine dehydrogenase [Pseudanabaena frigida]|uniref:Xanthine dehydrogenase n=1 Tax=Pseudanabaena frigida TaxID=945775 RepID=A0A2W4WBS7_9CYAN|nr:MAG: xanthine dehydrogenase [Pseudanabaena frigida]